MKKLVLILMLVLLSTMVVVAVDRPERVKNVKFGDDVRLELAVPDYVEVKVFEGTKVYFPIEGIEAEFWVNEITTEHVMGQLSVKGGKFVDKTLLKTNNLKKSNALKLNIYGGKAADMLLRYDVYRPMNEFEEHVSAILTFDVFAQGKFNADGSISTIGPDGVEVEVIEGTGGAVGEPKDSNMKYFYVMIIVLIVILGLVVGFRRKGDKEEVSFTPKDDSTVSLESKSEPVGSEVNVSAEVKGDVLEKKKGK